MQGMGKIVPRRPVMTAPVVPLQILRQRQTPTCKPGTWGTRAFHLQ